MKKLKSILGCLVVVTSTLFVWTASGEGTAHALSQTVGALDTPTVNNDRTISVSGWAVTSDYPTVPLGVRIRIDGHYTSSHYFVASRTRTLPAGYTSYGTNHGYSFQIGVPKGSHSICAEAQNSGVYNQIGSCKSVNVPATYADGYARYLGSDWNLPPGHNLTLGWNFASGSPIQYSSSITAGLASWTPWVGILQFSKQVDGVITNINFHVNTSASVMTGLRGLAYVHPCYYPGNPVPPAYDCQTTYVDVWLNFWELGYENSSSTGQIQSTVAHEIGHTMGLAHPPNPGANTVMAPDGNPYRTQTPYTFDSYSYLNIYGN